MHAAASRLLPQPMKATSTSIWRAIRITHPIPGLEYLFGVYLAKEDRYIDFWAHSLAEEPEGGIRPTPLFARTAPALSEHARLPLRELRKDARSAI